MREQTAGWRPTTGSPRRTHGSPQLLVAQCVVSCVGLVLASVAAQAIATRAEQRARLAAGAPAPAYLG